MSEHVALTPRPTTAAEVKRRLRVVLAQRAAAVEKPTPASAATVGHCDAAVDELLELLHELTGGSA